eukprot:tig00020725_g13542.t1
MRRPVDSSAIRREGRAMSKATGCEGSLDFNTDEGDGPVGLDSKVLNAAGVVQAKAVQEPLQGRQAWARIQESARLRDGLSAGRRASGWSGEELRSRPGRRPPQNVAPALNPLSKGREKVKPPNLVAKAQAAAPGEPPPRSFRFGGSLAPAADLRKLDGARAGALRRIPQVPRLAAAPSATRADVRGDLRTLLDLVLKPAHRFGGSASRGLRASRIASVELRFSAGRRQLRGEPLDSKPRTFPARPDVVRANVARAAGGRQASCIQSFEPVWLRAKRLAFWQETASCTLTRFVITHCVVDPTTYLVGSETEGGMTSVAGICEYISRTEGPDAAAAVAADVENGELDETIAAFGPGPLSLGESQPALQAIQFFEPADPENGPSRQGLDPRQGQAHPQLGPAFVPPPPSSHGQQHPPAAPGQQRIDEMLPRQGTPANGGAGPSGYGSSAPPTRAQPSLPRRRSRPPLAALRPTRSSAGAILSAIMGFGAQQGAERRALAARQAREAEARRQGLWAQRLQEATAFRAELEAGFRAERMSAAEAVESWRAFEDGTVELAKGLGYSYRRAPVPTSRRARRPRTTRASGTCTTEARGGALAATLTWLLGGTPTASAVIGVGFGYAAKSLYAPGCASQAAAGMRPAGR